MIIEGVTIWELSESVLDGVVVCTTCDEELVVGELGTALEGGE